MDRLQCNAKGRNTCTYPADAQSPQQEKQFPSAPPPPTITCGVAEGEATMDLAEDASTSAGSFHARTIFSGRRPPAFTKPPRPPSMMHNRAHRTSRRPFHCAPCLTALVSLRHFTATFRF